MGKKKPFPESPKAFGFLVTRYEGKHYPNAVLELLFCWWSAGVGDLALSSDNKKGYWKMFMQFFGKMNWRC